MTFSSQRQAVGGRQPCWRVGPFRRSRLPSAWCLPPTAYWLLLLLKVPGLDDNHLRWREDLLEGLVDVVDLEVADLLFQVGVKRHRPPGVERAGELVRQRGVFRAPDAEQLGVRLLAFLELAEAHPFLEELADLL